ncbi:MAG: disulfide bond formation protein B [Pseudomonadota bacterium]|nr:disulfide bond formation protein B [Pseudomonadota bacterium]
MKFSLPPHRTLVLLLALASALMLGAALASQHQGGLHPCALCLWQRWPHGVVAVLGALSLWLGQSAPHRKTLILMGLVLLAGAGIALFHVGVEQHWWAGTASCGGGLAKSVSLEELVNRIRTAPMVRCDTVAWSLFGISMAGYNGLISLLLGLVALTGAWKGKA